MLDLIHKLHAVLNALKGFDAGYTSSNDSEMLIGYNGKVYKVTLEEIENGKLSSDHIKHLK